MDQASVKRSKRVYLWVPVVFLLLAIPAALLLFSGIRNLTEGLVRFTAPGTATVTLDEPGTYTVFHEYRSTFGGRVYDGPATLPVLSIQMSGPEGTSAAPQPSTGDFNYSFGSRAGYAVGSVEIERSGEYQVTTAYDSESGGEVVLALGREKGLSTLQTVGGFVGLLAAGGLGLLVWFLIFIVRYSRSKKAPVANQDQSEPVTPAL